ncbi:MAG: hypothetical protein WDN49_14375 [Acetobacteraceae bacterium]
MTRENHQGSAGFLLRALDNEKSGEIPDEDSRLIGVLRDVDDLRQKLEQGGNPRLYISNRKVAQIMRAATAPLPCWENGRLHARGVDFKCRLRCQLAVGAVGESIFRRVRQNRDIACRESQRRSLLDLDINHAFLNHVDAGRARLKQHTEARPQFGRKDLFPAELYEPEYV